MTTTTALICGEKISDWTLVRPEGERQWLCKCKCGIEKMVNKYTLKNGLSKRCRSCASLEMKRSKFAEDLSCKKFYDWTVLSRADGDFDEPFWNCRCKCGNQHRVSGAALRKGKSQRCKSCASREKPRPSGLKSSPNLKGKKFGKWLVLEKAPSVGGRSRWFCECECGEKAVVIAQTLLNGHSSKCRKCYKPDGNITHGCCTDGKIPEYHIWNSMKNRCLNPNDKGFKNYGARGISVCDEWKNSFESFYEYVGQRPFDGASIDRIDNDGNYEPGNVRWATPKEQMANTRKQKYGICVTQWCRENNLDRFHVAAALKDGVPLDKMRDHVKKNYKEY